MANIVLALQPGEQIFDGKQITFKAPCDCTTPSGLSIDGKVFSIVDALGNSLLGGDGKFASGVMISVLLDVTNSRAFILNSAAGSSEAVNNQTPTFSVASSRANISSGEKLSVILGKIMKFFADLKTVAFSGSYSDLSNKPTIPAAVAVKGNAESSYRTGNVNLTPANIGAAAVSHGNHVPTTQTASNKVFLRNDNTWQTITPANIGAAASSHTQAASTITAGTLAGKVQANASAAATLNSAQVRDIYVSGSAVTEGGSSSLANGTIVFTKG